MKQNRFLLLLAAAVLGMGWATRAVAQPNGVWVERKSGSRVGYAFTEQPRISYSATTLTVTAGAAQVEVPLSEVKRIYFADDWTPDEPPTPESTKGLWIDRRGAERIGYRFAQQPRLAYTATTLAVTADGVTRVELALADVERVWFDDEVTPTSVGETMAAERPELVRLTPGGVQLSGFHAGTAVMVYDAGGRMVSRMATDAEGRASVELSGLPGGLYIVRAGQNVVKVKNKK